MAVLCIFISFIALIIGVISNGDHKTSTVSASSIASSSPPESPTISPSSSTITSTASADASGETFDIHGSQATSTEAPNAAQNAVTSVDINTVHSSESQDALDKLNTLDVKGRAPKTGYDRDQFGKGWVDTDHNGCDTRNDILRRDLQNVMAIAGTRGCKIATGVLSDPYTSTTINFQRGQKTSDDVQIDHVVALSDAWQKGAQGISEQQRIEFANDPINLLAVDGPTNQKKSDGDAATWLPPNTKFRCDYVSKQIDVKSKYGLWVTEAEKKAMSDVLVSPDCGAKAPAPTTQAPEPTQEPTSEAPIQAPAAEKPAEEVAPAPLVEEPPAEAPAPAEQAPAPVEQAPVEQPVQPAQPAAVYANCSEAKAAGVTPLYAGSPGYSSKLDRDGDGIACEK